MGDKTLRDAVELFKKEFNSSMFDSRYTMLKEAGLLVLALATRYLELGGVVEEKYGGSRTGGICEAKDRSEGGCDANWEDYNQYNSGRQDTLLAVMKRLDKVEKMVFDLIYQYPHITEWNSCTKKTKILERFSDVHNRRWTEELCEDIIAVICNAIKGEGK